MRKVLVLLFLISYILLGACNRCPSQGELFKPSSPKASWLVKFLEDPTCQPPCWENIIPGETMMSNAEDLLEEVPNVQDASHYNHNLKEYVSISWKFAGTSDKGKIYSSRNGQNVERISFDVNLYENYSLFLIDIIEAYGSPSYVFTSLERNMCYCFTGLAYESKGMFIYIYHLCKRQYTWGEVSSERINLTEKTPIYAIFLSSPDGESWQASIPENIIEWNGYSEYLFK